MLNNPQGTEAEQMRSYLTSFISPTVVKLRADWNTKMKEHLQKAFPLTPETNFEELINNSHVAMVNENTGETIQNEANEISRIWWDAYRRKMLENNGKYDAIGTAKVAADAEVNAFKTALGGVKAAGGSSSNLGGRNTKRKRQSKKTKAKKHHKKSNKKRHTKSSKSRKTK
jgi:hypothetical protein